MAKANPKDLFKNNTKGNTSDGAPQVVDLNLDKVKSVSDLVTAFGLSGFQSSSLADAVRVIEEMKKDKDCIVYFGFTANLIASGLRGVVTELCKKKIIDVVVTTAGSLEHDLIKHYKPYLKGDFDLDDNALHKQGINRIGNVLVPSDRYVVLEEKIKPIFTKMLASGKAISPSGISKEIGLTLGEDSFQYWCSKNNIPVFCPGITDGALGLQMYFFKQDHKDFSVDVTADMKTLADITLNAEKTGAIILGGGITKHHIIGANIVRDGLNYAVYFTTASEFDGSLSGARPKEAKSWGKISASSKTATVYGDATITFPIVVKALKERGAL